MELIPFRRKSEPPVLKSARERAFDSTIEAKNCDTELRKATAYYCMAKDAACLAFSLVMFSLAAAGYMPFAFLLTPIAYGLTKIKGKNFDRVVESIFNKRE